MASRALAEIQERLRPAALALCLHDEPFTLEVRLLPVRQLLVRLPVQLPVQLPVRLSVRLPVRPAPRPSP
jgi:hypothetical protein